ncbi:AcrR family transcriptional regulator [Sphingomonas zeicaulis]|uniref:TetR family transcriptional regulator n=1 Tax=Sphingomonas zeicaulis TaxID=1632740 RepID=UPI003D2507BC
MATDDTHPRDLRADLISATLAAVATAGIDSLSLRAITATVGKSTTAVFQHFGGKDGLLLATMKDAVARSAAAHEALRAKLAGLPQTPDDLAAAIAFYILDQSRDPASRVCLELLFRHRQFPDAAPLLRDWDAMRRAFWHALLDDGPFAPLADVIATCSIIELGFASALGGEPGYALLLRGTLTALFECQAGTPVDRRASTAAIDWLMAGRFPDETMTAPPGAAMERLLDCAAATIIREGLAGLNVRRLASEAAVTPSLIVYHYGDFASFVNAAVWHAMMRGLPSMLNVDEPDARQPAADADRWRTELERATRPGEGDAPAGFYVNYARILGQLGMAAPRQPELVPLMLKLRVIEGLGIHRSSRLLWPDALKLGRPAAAGFAIWIKGRAILNEALALSPDVAGPGDGVLDAAAALAGIR